MYIDNIESNVYYKDESKDEKKHIGRTSVKFLSILISASKKLGSRCKSSSSWPFTLK